MGFTDRFRAQHDEILQLAGEITDHLKRSDADPVAVRKLLSNLAGKVTFHLAMEDQALYPRLKTSSDPKVEALAGRFQTEMGGLAGVFTQYNARWSATAIRGDLASFTNDTRKVFGALAHRIQRENGELYPLADNAA